MRLWMFFLSSLLALLPLTPPSDDVEALSARARSSAVQGERQAALDALGRLGGNDAARALDGMFDDLDPQDRAACATALSRSPAGRERLLVRTIALVEGRERVDDATLAALLAGYGRALAEAPGGGESPRERAPFALARRHPSSAVAHASTQAFEEFLQRTADLGAIARADSLLALFAEDGFSAPEMHFRRAYLALAAGDDPRAARARAAELLSATEGAESSDERLWRFYGETLAGVAELACGSAEAALSRFDAASEVVLGLIALRVDLRPERTSAALFAPSEFLHRWPRAPAAGAVQTDLLELAGVAEMWRALALLEAQGGEPSPAFLAPIRRAHTFLLRAQLMGIQTDVSSLEGTLDAALEHVLSPTHLFFANARMPGWTAGEGLDRRILLGQALAAVAPSEMPGFEPLVCEGASAAGALGDPLRRALLAEIRTERMRAEDRRRRPPGFTPEQWEARLRERHDLLTQTENRELAAFDGLVPSDREDLAVLAVVFAKLDLERFPSELARRLAEDLREEGRPAEGRALAARMLAALASAHQGARGIAVEQLAAQLELAIASAFMDEREPARAEESALSSVGRLEALENTLAQWRKSPVEGAQGETDRAQIDAWTRQVRALRASALLSLAVNANVRMGDRERALGYFERAWEIEQNDAMRVLLACYRARSGHAEEARAALAGVRPSPELYYNLACTHALLGDVPEALRWLQRELEENHPTPGSLERQKSWAREDPDLELLRPELRFQTLVAE